MREGAYKSLIGDFAKTVLGQSGLGVLPQREDYCSRVDYRGWANGHTLHTIPTRKKKK